MTNEVLSASMSLYEDSLKSKIKLSGRQVLFVDDSQEMLTLIEVMLRNKFNLLEGYIIEPNPVFARHTLEWLMSRGIAINDFIKCAVLDVDFGIYGKDVSVNDLIQIFLQVSVPVILFSAIAEDSWRKYVDKKYHDKVEFISKGDIQAMNKIYTLITEKDGMSAI